MGEKSVTCAKIVLSTCSTLIMFTGFLVLVVGIFVQFSYNHYSNFVGDTIWTAPMIFIIIGVIVTIIGIMGCCGACNESPCMMLMFCILAFIVLIVEIAIGIGGYIKHGELHDIIEYELNKTIIHSKERQDYYDAWTILQTELQCCGTNGPNDWINILNNTKDLPSSCCNIIVIEEANHCTIAHANEGCFNKLFTVLNSNTLILAGFAIGVATIQILTILISCCLRRSFGRNYQVV